MTKKPINVEKTPIRSTGAEQNQRVTEVHSLLLEGQTRHAILQYASKWGVSDRQVDSYIAKATDLIQEINKQSQEQAAAFISRALIKVYRDADRPSDKVSALKELARIKGLGANNVNVTLNDSRELKELSEKELEALYDGSEE